jgi:hypothetical protein
VVHGFRLDFALCVNIHAQGCKINLQGDRYADLILAQTGCDAPGASSTSKHKSASVFSCQRQLPLARKFKPPASLVVVDLFCRSAYYQSRAQFYIAVE